MWLFSCCCCCNYSKCKPISLKHLCYLSKYIGSKMYGQTLANIRHYNIHQSLWLHIGCLWQEQRDVCVHLCGTPPLLAVACLRRGKGHFLHTQVDILTSSNDHITIIWYKLAMGYSKPQLTNYDICIYLPWL